jgi:hypothetical protein
MSLRVETLRGHDVGGLELTVAQAARLCRVSQDAICRQLRARRLPHARRAGSGVRSAWAIPVDDLVSAQLCTPAEAEMASDVTTPKAMCCVANSLSARANWPRPTFVSRPPKCASVNSVPLSSTSAASNSCAPKPRSWWFKVH